MKKSRFVTIFTLILCLILVGCNFPKQKPQENQVDLLNTAAAQTVQAKQTLIAQPSEVPPTLPPSPTHTLDQSEPTLAPTSPPTAEPTAEPTAVPTITATSTPEIPCDQASFVSETIPDGTDFFPGQGFTKTWTIKNTGSCTWTADYHVVFFSGNAMGAPAARSLTTGTVAPGQTIQISLEMQAPITSGTYQGDFKLRNAGGVLFGIGAKDGPFWVKINVYTLPYDFTENVCASGVKWTSGAGTLPCPGKYDDHRGWVLVIDKPTLENKTVENKPGMQVHPDYSDKGWIRGTYPEITLPGSTIFRATIGCYGNEKCDVKFKLNARIDGGDEQTLATWSEIQDGKVNKVEFDLSHLAGKKVQFILMVDANGSPTNDVSLWFGPRIESK